MSRPDEGPTMNVRQLANYLSRRYSAGERLEDLRAEGRNPLRGQSEADIREADQYAREVSYLSRGSLSGVDPGDLERVSIPAGLPGGSVLVDVAVRYDQYDEDGDVIPGSSSYQTAQVRLEPGQTLRDAYNAAVAGEWVNSPSDAEGDFTGIESLDVVPFDVYGG